MARLITLPLLVLVLSIFCGSIKPTLGRRPRPRSRLPGSRSYVESMCSTTLYKDLCVRSLSVFPESDIQSPDQLAQHALAVSLYKAKRTRSYMLKVASELKAMKAKEYPLVKDCLSQINDGVDQLTKSIQELQRLKEQEGHDSTSGDDLLWHINCIETWTSAALTDAFTCMDNFPGRNMSKLKATIKGKVLNVAETTSNALALFHRYASRYKARASTTSPKKP